MESVFFANDIIARMEQVLARIPENCRHIYRMHILDGMRVSEISLETGEEYKTIENRLGIARRQMRQFLRAAV
jgi:RNA polymerase sigma-70 factor (ECF subfamily)